MKSFFQYWNIIIFLLLLTLILHACTTMENKTTGSVHLSDLNQLKLNLQNLDNFNLSNHKPWLKITDNKVSGFSGCNRFTGKVEQVNTFTGLSIQFTGFSSTRKYCNNVMKLENKFLQLLKITNRIEYQKGFYKLYKNNDLLMYFKESSN